MKTLDPVSLGIIWDRLISITDEIVSSLIRTSFSIAVRESYDLSCVLFDDKGRSLAQGSFSVPSFTGTSGPTIRHMFAKFPPHSLKPGDVVVTNDPWMGTGHLYDICVMRPIFRKGRLIGFTMSITHLPDIGGVGNSARPTEIYEEGLRLPVCKLVREGQINQELIDIIRTNVRIADQVIGDIMANISCNEVGDRLVNEFMDEYGVEDLSYIADAIIEQSQQITRDGIDQIPNGEYRNELDIEGIDDPIRLACHIVKRDGEVAIDFAGTGGCVKAAINVPLCYTHAWANYSIKCLTSPGTPNNEGSVRPIRTSAPTSCILNAQPPWPTAGRHSVGHFVVPLIFGALSDVLPGTVQADSGMMNIFNVKGQSRHGRPFASLYFLSGGFGALRDLDGPPTTPFPSNMGVVPTEVWEGMSSMRVEERRLLIDSGGPGKTRGGIAQSARLINDGAEPLTLSLMGLRTTFPAQGSHGGMPGMLRQYSLNGKRINPKGTYTLQPGDVIELEEAGGGGFGNPLERDTEQVLEDVQSGFVSVAAAQRDYGVLVNEDKSGASRIQRV